MKILREKQIRDLTGISRVTRWRMEKLAKFPRRIQLTKRCVGWSESEVLDWLKVRIEARESSQIMPLKSSEKSTAK
jgi:prophage regulatory protein